MKKNELLAVAWVCGSAFAILVSYLSLSAGPVFFLLNLAVFFIAVSYSKYLSKHPVISLFAYPSGLILTMSAAYLLGAGVIDYRLVMYLAPIFVIFLGASVWIAVADVETDRKTGKGNIGLLIGVGNAKLLALGLIIAGLLLALLTLGK